MATTTTVEKPPRAPEQQKVKDWLAANYGVLSRVAREFDLSVAFVQRVAYNNHARSKGLKVERRLLELGCPLIQRLQ